MILSDLPLLSLVLFFIWRNGEPFLSIGFTFKNIWREAALGVVLFIPIMLIMAAVEAALRAGGLSVPQTAPTFLVPSGTFQIGLAVVFLIVVAVSEEVIFRGYLIKRFASFSNSPIIALFISSAIFAVGHGYQRTGGMLGVGVLGLIFGVVYLWRRSLTAPIVMHFIQNFLGIIALPFGLPS
ncbi:MAG: CPBP family intramembrane glutamic endopeptidase [Desulfobacterales bacterium]